MDETPVLVAQRNGYRVITLNRPERMNAINEATSKALLAALQDAKADTGLRALVITGTGRGFCAGADLSARQSTLSAVPIDTTSALEKYYNPTIRLIRAIEAPVICAVNGTAAGAGVNLALACDIVLAAKSAKFLQAFARIGLVPDAGGTWFLPRLVGDARARALAMLAEPITAEQAAAWGMIWRVVEDAQVLVEAENMAAHFATQPTVGLALMKQAFNASAGNTLNQQLDLERDLQGEAGRTPDFAEGVRAFMEKRPAKFTGRR